MIPHINVERTGENIKRLMLGRELSVRDIYTLLGFANPTAVYKWFRGDALPAIDNLVILADLFECAIDDILIIERG